MKNPPIKWGEFFFVLALISVFLCPAIRLIAEDVASASAANTGGGIADNVRYGVKIRDKANVLFFKFTKS